MGPFIVVLFLSGCAGFPAEKRPLARFDTSHGEIFSAFGEGPLDYADFRLLMTEAGFEVLAGPEPVTPESLQNLRLLVIAGPTRPFEEREIKALGQFVAEGGRLLVLLHIAPPVARLTESMGIFVSNFVVSEKEGILNNKPQDFLATRFVDHPVTKQLERIAVFGTWGLLAEEPARVVAETSPEAWVDLNRDGIADDEEPRQSFGLVAIAQPGTGRVIVVADDAPFATRFLSEADNRTLAGNIVNWLK